MRAFYFGVWPTDNDGHFAWEPGGRSVSPRQIPWPWGYEVDAHLAPRTEPPREVNGKLRRQGAEMPEGVAALHHRDGWSALSFWDRTGDSRGNSNSTFIFDEVLTFEEALDAAREQFPQVFARLTFDVVEAPA